MIGRNNRGVHKNVTPRKKRLYEFQCHNMDDMYKYYKEDHPSVKVDAKTYKNILKDLNKLIADKLLEGEDFSFPITSDVLAVRKKKLRVPEDKEKRLKMLGVDYKSSNFFKKVILHLNEHSDYFLGKFKWYKPRNTSKDTFKKWYSFTACTHLKESLSKILVEKEGHKKYFEYR